MSSNNSSFAVSAARSHSVFRIHPKPPPCSSPPPPPPAPRFLPPERVFRKSTALPPIVSAIILCAERAPRRECSATEKAAVGQQAKRTSETYHIRLLSTHVKAINHTAVRSANSEGRSTERTRQLANERTDGRTDGRPTEHSSKYHAMMNGRDVWPRPPLCPLEHVVLVDISRFVSGSGQVSSYSPFFATLLTNSLRPL